MYNSLTSKKENIAITEINGNNYTLIEVDNKKYAIETRNVLEIVKVMQLENSYRMPSYILGMIEYDRKPVGVIDLREVFNKERIVYDLSAKIIVIKARDIIVSVICDKICDIKGVFELISFKPIEKGVFGLFFNFKETINFI